MLKSKMTIKKVVDRLQLVPGSIVRCNNGVHNMLIMITGPVAGNGAYVPGVVIHNEDRYHKLYKPGYTATDWSVNQLTQFYGEVTFTND